MWLLHIQWPASQPSRPRRSLRERVAVLQQAEGASVVLLALIAAVAAIRICLFLEMPLALSGLACGLTAISAWVWGARFVSTPQKGPWRRGLQGSIRKITAFVVGGFLTALLLSPFEETLTIQVVCLFGGVLFAVGPTSTSAQSARRLAE